MANRANQIIRLTPSVFILSMLLTAAGAKTIYVDRGAAGANNGSSWADAYTFLQEALADANLSEKPVEIRVAQGTYRPNQGLVAIPEFDWRTATFQLINGVTLKGGYAGFGQPDPNARDVGLYKTFLSGDLNGNDVDVADPCDLLNEPTRADNSYHVVTGSGTNDSAIIDGFTITAGNANVANRVRDGGGMYVHSGSPILRACTFIMNSAYDGGAIYNYEGRPALTDCVFSHNNAYYGGGGVMNFFNGSPVVIGCTFGGNSAEWGGGMYNSWDCDPALTHCIFNSNSANDDGGGLLNEENSNPNVTDCVFSQNVAYGNNGGGMCNLNLSSPTVLNCTFTKNTANTGGGMANTFKSNPTLTNCTFSANRANGGGGMGSLWDSSPTLANCTFSGNVAIYQGGGMDNSWDSNSVLSNCTFVGNSAVDVGGVYNSWDGGCTLNNCILWSNALSQVTASTVISYSDVQGGYEGDGNLDADPLFANPGYWADANDPNVVVEPNDPNAVWVDGDYHLKSQAGRWDPVGESWVKDDVTSPCIDAGDPNSPIGDEPEPNGGRINMGAYGGTKEASKSPVVAQTVVYIQWLGHSSVKLWAEDCIVYVDPQSLSIAPHDATLVLVTHSHGDHYSPSDIARVANAQTQFVAPPDVVALYGKGQAIAPGQTIESYCAWLIGVAAYNTNKTNHLKSRNWVGYVIELGGKRIYVAGDTDLIDEMKSLGDIDVAILPAGGTYTMNAVEAAEATQYIKPDLAIPYHWGQVVGTIADAQTFAQLARCAVKILAVGETIASDNWPVYSPLVAHWKLDETAGDIADDSAGDYDGTLHGGPAWQPAGGKTGGALQLDGIDDYVGTPFVSNPNKGPFSVYAWVKGGAAGQVIVSQADGTASGETWLGTEPVSGKFVSGLVPAPAGRTVTPALKSEFVITDGQWHHIGFVWDGSLRRLYVDGAEVAKDAAAVAPPKSSDGGLHLGAGKSLDAGTFWAGLLDDVRIYNVALSPAELEQIAR